MIDFTVLPLFLTSVILLVISPGPDLLLVSSYSSSRGFNSGLLIAFGIFIAGLIQTALVAFGLGELMQSVPIVATMIRMIGAIYLAWLGINMVVAWINHRQQVQEVSSVMLQTSWQLVKIGMLNNLLNPKALMFFSLFLPQFTSPSLGVVDQILILGGLLSLIAFIANAFFAFFVSKLACLLSQRMRLAKHVDGVLGVLFLFLAGRLAWKG